MLCIFRRLNGKGGHTLDCIAQKEFFGTVMQSNVLPPLDSIVPDKLSEEL